MHAYVHTFICVKPNKKTMLFGGVKVCKACTCSAYRIREPIPDLDMMVL